MIPERSEGRCRWGTTEIQVTKSLFRRSDLCVLHGQAQLWGFEVRNWVEITFSWQLSHRPGRLKRFDGDAESGAVNLVYFWQPVFFFVFKVADISPKSCNFPV